MATLPTLSLGKAWMPYDDSVQLARDEGCRVELVEIAGRRMYVIESDAATVATCRELVTCRGELADWNALATVGTSIAPVIMRCATCHSTDVRADAYAAWSVTAQAWELVTTFDATDCGACGCERDLEAVPITPTE